MCAAPRVVGGGPGPFLQSQHPGARALRRVGVVLVVFTLPAVLLLLGVIPEPAGNPNAMLFLLAWVAIGVFAPAAMLWSSARAIAEYVGHFPVLRRTMGVGLLVAGAAMGVMGWMAMTDPTAQGGRVGTVFTLMGLMLFGGWRMLRGGHSPPPG